MGLFENKLEKDYFYTRLTSLGDFYPLRVHFDPSVFFQQLSDSNPEWVKYNKSKSWSNRYGLSLFSLNGEVSGEIDLNSIREWNLQNGTKYNELSFNTPTPYWSTLKVFSDPLQDIEKHIGRSHLLKLDEGGLFPPHRDNYHESDQTFRLISLINCSINSLHLTLNNRLVPFNPNQLYFMDTRKVHSIVSYCNDSLVLVLNIKICKQTVQYVFERLVDC